MGNPFDSIPAGKKPAYSAEFGWHLVDLDFKSYDDLKIIYDETFAKLKRTTEDYAKLKKENKRLASKIESLEIKNQELTLTLQGNKKSKK